MKILQCPVVECRSQELELVTVERSQEEVVTGVILCNSCKRWYPVINTIPHLLPDLLRGVEDSQFVKKLPNDFPYILNLSTHKFSKRE
jgi:uncharacterized protein YbaR (Trm112 family)